MPDTVCYTIPELRDLLGNIAIGNEGIERFELELRLHANTWGRWKSCLSRENDLKGVIVQKDVVIGATEDKRKAWEHDANRWKRKARARGLERWLWRGGVAVGGFYLLSR